MERRLYPLLMNNTTTNSMKYSYYKLFIKIAKNKYREIIISYHYRITKDNKI